MAYQKILVVGCGPVGALLAIFLDKIGFQVTIHDLKNKQEILSLKDHRATALSKGNLDFLKQTFGGNPLLEGALIKRILTQDGILGPQIKFESCKKSINSFGENIENSCLKAVIYDYLFSKTQVQFETTLPNTEDFALTIAADGKNSVFKPFATGKIFEHDYGHDACVSTLKMNAPLDVAYERFFKTGPIAVLPLKNNQASLIWSLENKFARILKEKSASEFLEILNIHLEGILEKKTYEITTKTWFPLKANFILPPYGKQLLFMGDSANSMHPVAGQGLNLSIRNIRIFVELAKKHMDLGLDIGSQTFLETYWKEARLQVLPLLAATHSLVKIFDFESKSLNIVKKIGLNLLEKSPTFKAIATRFASY